MARVKSAVLISGRGSNLAALIEAARAPDYPAEIALVLSNSAEAKGLEYARGAGHATAVVDHRQFEDRAAFEKAVTLELERSAAELVCLAGFMRVLTADFVARWRDRLLNIHPSLLPAFPGLDTHAWALKAGVKLHGCTVHFVRTALDQGPIVGQAAVPVLPDDDESRLAARVLAAEHRLYPRCLALVASGQARVVGERVVFGAAASAGAELSLLNPRA